MCANAGKAIDVPAKLAAATMVVAESILGIGRVDVRGFDVGERSNERLSMNVG